MDSKKSEASELFNISRNTIDLWFKRLQETGDFQVPYRINLLVIITKFLIGQNFKSLLAPMETRPTKKGLRLWPEEISDRTISRALKKIGFTRKKNL
jgi:transposase